MTTTDSKQTGRQGGLLTAMDREWPLVVAGSRGRRAWRRWAPEVRAGGVELDELDGLDQLVDIIRHPGDHTRSDVVARVLICAAQAGDDLATRTLMQGLVPFVGRLARLHARYSAVPLEDVAAEVLAAVQLRIMRTRLDERHRLLVAYLQLTVRRQLRRGDSARLLRTRPEVVVDDLEPTGADDRRHLAAGWPHAIDTLGQPGTPRTTVEHIAAIVADGVRAGVLTLDDAELLLLVAAGNSAAAIGRRLQRDRSVISRRIGRAAHAAGRVAA